MAPAFFKKPYPFTESIEKAIRGNLLIGLFIAVFLIVFQPFEINLWITPNKFLKLAGFGIISFLVPTIIAFITRKIINPITREERWTIGKEITSISIVLCCIAAANLLYGHFLGIMPFNSSGFFTILFFTLILGVFPVSLHVMQKHNRLMIVNLEKAQAINSEIDQKREANEALPVSVPPVQKINLTAENEKDVLCLDAGCILFIESADNYSSVYFLENNEVKKKLIRSSLKRIEAQINDKGIARCHRAFIVNLSKITSVLGNAAGYKLSLSGTETVIPVSRTYISIINELNKPKEN
jgi:hypothetical protein